MKKAMELKIIAAKANKVQIPEGVEEAVGRLVKHFEARAEQGETSVLMGPLTSNLSSVIDGLVSLGYTVNQVPKGGTVYLDVDWA